MSRVNRIVYDQRASKPMRYLLFPLDELITFGRTLGALRHQPGAVVFAEGSYFSFASGFAAKFRRSPMIWDNHGNIVTFAKVQGKSSFFTRGNVMFERVLERMSTKVLVVNQKDKDDYISMGYSPKKLEVVPTCADMRIAAERSCSRAEARRRLGISEEELMVLFVGTLNYGPNLDAARYIVQELTPAIVPEFPKVRFYLAGSGSVDIPFPESDVFPGFVDDMYLWLSAADVSIAPLWKGLGILTKVIEAMSAGRPTVVTPLAMEGIPELAHGKNCLLGKDREDFAAQLKALLEDEGLRDSLGNEGKHLIQKFYSCDVIADRLVDILREAHENEE
jgi:glycosyltransferase involved in cell wall biosynthesis